MNDDDLDYQAAKLNDYTSRGGSASRWFRSKGFRKAVRYEIARRADAAGLHREYPEITA